MYSLSINKEIELKLLELRHAQEVFNQIEKDREYLSRWLTWENYSKAIEDTKGFIQNELNRFANNSGFTNGIFYKKKFVGCIGIHDIDWINKKTSIGYWLGQSFQGKGIMTTACKSITNYAINELLLNRVEIRACTGNLKSRAIPERLGYKHEGTIRQAERIRGHFYDHEVYGIIAAEWNEVKKDFYQ
jgi:ribosomal-protein-serine acetyltransferase